MKVCIYGAGAIGGHLAARLVSSGTAEVSVVARGPHLAAMRDKGILLKAEGRTFGGPVAHATDDPDTLGPQDLVVVTLKTQSQPAIAAPLARLLDQGGVALFAQNGIPWWWNHGLGRGGALKLLDPEGELWTKVGGARVIGGVINSANAVTEPGVVVNTAGKRWLLGEPDNSRPARLDAVAKLLSDAGLDTVVTTDIRKEIWRKLCTNVSANPIAALTRNPQARVAGLPELAMGLIDETLAVAAAMGSDLRGEVDPRTIVKPNGGRQARPSMLQDVDAGRPLEVDSILGQIAAFAREAKVPTPKIDVVLPLLAGLDAWLREQQH
jgi:2-dehydropantoate 2-reductase